MYDSGWYKMIMYGLEFVGLYYSSYRGFVIDNVDSDELNRLKIISPIINSIDNEKGIWAYPKNNWGGKDYGVNILPRKGDMIWVEFEHGSLQHPIWSFASYGENEKPAEFDTPEKYGFKTPAGNLIIIDDTEGAEKILVRRKGELEYIQIEVNKITLEAPNLYLGKDGEEQAIMGNTLNSKLDEILDAINAHTHLSASPGSPSSVPSNIAAFTTIKTALPAILSNLVKLDKD